MKHRTLAFAGSLMLSVCAGCLDPSEDGLLVPETVDEDPSLPQEAWNGSNFHLESFGAPDAPVIVVLHGGPGEDYRSLLRLRNEVDGERLEDAHRLVFWDQRGSGLSRRHDRDQISTAAYLSDLEQLIDRLSPDRAVMLIGHSWGGMYASLYIGRHPERVAGAALLECGPLTSARFRKIAGEVRQLDYGSEWLNDYAWGGGVMSSYDHARADYLFMLGYLGNSQPTYHLSQSDREPLWRYGAVAGSVLASTREWDFTQGLERFQTKVLFQASSLNTTTGEAFQRMQMRDYPNAEFSLVEGVGHDFPRQNPEGTLRPIMNYLSEIGF